MNFWVCKAAPQRADWRGVNRARSARETPTTHKTRLERRVCIVRQMKEEISLATRISFICRFYASPILATGDLRLDEAPPGGLLPQPRRPFCSISYPSDSTCIAPSAGICTGLSSALSGSPIAPASAGRAAARSPLSALSANPPLPGTSLSSSGTGTSPASGSGCLAAGGDSSIGSRRTSCRERCPTSERAVSHQRKQKNSQLRKKRLCLMIWLNGRCG